MLAIGRGVPCSFRSRLGVPSTAAGHVGSGIAWGLGVRVARRVRPGRSRSTPLRPTGYVRTSTGNRKLRKFPDRGHCHWVIRTTDQGQGQEDSGSMAMALRAARCKWMMMMMMMQVPTAK
jgi:hypothetical protein